MKKFGFSNYKFGALGVPNVTEEESEIVSTIQD